MMMIMMMMMMMDSDGEEGGDARSEEKQQGLGCGGVNWGSSCSCSIKPHIATETEQQSCRSSMFSLVPDSNNCVCKAAPCASDQ